MDDGELIRAIRGGDRAALAVLYQRYVKAVWRYAHAHLSSDWEQTEDLVSETFLAAIRTVQTFDLKQGTVYGWLLGIARNKLRDHFRRAHRVMETERAEISAVADRNSRDPDEGAIAAETRDAVIRTLDAMNDDERLVLEWKYVESLSVQEIAERLGRRGKAVEAILYRARASFRTIHAREQTRTA